MPNTVLNIRDMNIIKLDDNLDNKTQYGNYKGLNYDMPRGLQSIERHVTSMTKYT